MEGSFESGNEERRSCVLLVRHPENVRRKQPSYGHKGQLQGQARIREVTVQDSCVLRSATVQGDMWIKETVMVETGLILGPQPVTLSMCLSMYRI